MNEDANTVIVADTTASWGDRIQGRANQTTRTQKNIGDKRIAKGSTLSMEIM